MYQLYLWSFQCLILENKAERKQTAATRVIRKLTDEQATSFSLEEVADLGTVLGYASLFYMQDVQL